MTKPPPTREAFVVAAVIAAFPLLMLATIAPLGNTWVWNEFPRHITFVACVLGLVAMFRKTPSLPVLVPFLTAGIALAWELFDEYRGLSKFGRTDLLGSEMNLLFDLSFIRLAPWLTGGLYGALAVLSVRRSREARRNWRRAGAWLAVAGAIAAVFTLTNENWLTFENLNGNGTYTSSVPWEGTKKLSMFADALAVVAGLAAIVASYKYKRPKLPTARVV
jgi:hypothetical protein